MNKKELIEKYKAQLKDCTPFGKLVSHDLIVSHFLDDLKQLDEPQKPVVPQFVADWIEKCKSEKRRLHESLTYTPFGVNGWISNPKNQEIFAQAWINGYEVEKEKRYYIRLKNVDENYNYLTCIKHLNAWVLTEIKRDKKFRTEHTKEQLEEGGFGEVFDSPLFEVEEVEG